MRDKVKTLLANKIETLTGIKPIFNVHKVPRELNKEILFVRLDNVTRDTADVIDIYTFEVYYAYKVVSKDEDVQIKTFDIAQKIQQLNGENEYITDDEGQMQQIVFWLVDEDYTEDYSETIGVVVEGRFLIRAYISNKYVGG